MSARIVPAGLIQSSNESAIEEINLQNVKENTVKGPRQMTGKKCANTERKKFAVEALVADKKKKSPSLSPSFNESESEKRAAKLRREDNLAAKAFKIFDLDGDGTLAVSELTNLADKLAHDVGKDVIFKIIEQCDKDGDSVLTLDEFTEIFRRFNEERHALHRAETELLKEKFDLDVNPSLSAKCAHACVGTAETTFCVYHKFLLLLVSTAVMALMLPLFKIAYQARGYISLSSSFIVQTRVKSWSFLLQFCFFARA